MKNYIKSILLAIVLLLTFGCSDSFLDEVARDRITADNLYSAPEGFENGLNAIYALIRLERTSGSGFYGTRAWLFQGSTDDYYSSRYGSRGLFYIEWGSHMNSTTGSINSTFNWLYEIINSANTIISRAESANVAWDNDAQRNEVVGQARLFRAWAYRHLISTWGDVPLNLEESSGDNVKTDWSRAPKAEVMQAMEADLLFAETALPSEHTTPGKLSNVVAQHYLAELYLMMGDPAKAEVKAQAAVDNPNYSLITSRYGIKSSEPGVPFMDQFYDGNVLRSEGNTEVLWEILDDRDALGGNGNVMRRSWMIRYSVNAGVSINPAWGRGTDFYAVTKHAFDLYEDGDDRASDYAIHNIIPKDDGTFLETTTEGKQEPTRDKLWPSTSKWDDGDPENLGRGEGYNDQPYLRLADTYLLLAEAQHLQGKNDAAATNLNVLRNRSNATPITAVDVDIDFILDERTRELLTEEHRRHTLIRLGKWLERTRLYNSQSSGFIEDKNVLLPIPQSVIDANLDLEMPNNVGY